MRKSRLSSPLLRTNPFSILPPAFRHLGNSSEAPRYSPRFNFIRIVDLWKFPLPTLNIKEHNAENIRHKVANTHVWSSSLCFCVFDVFYVLSGTSGVGMSTQHVFTQHVYWSQISVMERHRACVPHKYFSQIRGIIQVFQSNQRHRACISVRSGECKLPHAHHANPAK